MAKAQEFMTKPVLTVKEDMIIADVATLLAERHLSCVIIEKKGAMIGILTERDLVRDVLAQGKDPKKTHVKEIMDTNVLTVAPTMDLFEIIAFMRKNGLRRVPVLKNKKAIGIITETDIVNETLRLERNLAQELESKKLSVSSYEQKHREILRKLQAIKNIHNKASSGSKDFDAILGGGFPLGGSILIYGPPGAGKTLVAYSFLNQGLVEGDSCVYMCANESLKEIRSGFKTLGYNTARFEKEKKLEFINLSGDLAAKKDPAVVYLSASMQFKDIYYIKKIIEDIQKKSQKHTRVFVNVVSQALMMWSPQIVYRFVADLCEFFRNLNITAVFQLDKGIGGEATLSALEQIMDGTVYFTVKEEGINVTKQLLVKKMKGGSLLEQRYYTFDFKPHQGILITFAEQ
jgi:KaiC/GvpD/RAD55 family RecA-like ATPase/CBS domain-containing protein